MASRRSSLMEAKRDRALVDGAGEKVCTERKLPKSQPGPVNFCEDSVSPSFALGFARVRQHNVNTALTDVIVAANVSSMRLLARAERSREARLRQHQPRRQHYLTNLYIMVRFFLNRVNWIFFRETLFAFLSDGLQGRGETRPIFSL
jgi:hypothetical protein